MYYLTTTKCRNSDHNTIILRSVCVTEHFVIDNERHNEKHFNQMKWNTSNRVCYVFEEARFSSVCSDWDGVLLYLRQGNAHEPPMPLWLPRTVGMQDKRWVDKMSCSLEKKRFAQANKFNLISIQSSWHIRVILYLYYIRKQSILRVYFYNWIDVQTKYRYINIR